MSDYCIIGGNGFIGSQIVSILAAGGKTVTVIGRRDIAGTSLPEGVRYIAGNYSDPKVMDIALSSSTRIVHLAYSSVPKTSFEDPVQDIIDNLPETVKLLEIALKKNIERLVFVSSGGTIYGDAENEPVKESHKTSPKSPYGISKLAAEKYTQMYNLIYGLPSICVRPGNAYGPGQIPFRGQGFIATAMASVLQGKELIMYGKNGTVRDYIYVRDVARGIIAALDYGTPGEIYNIGSACGRNNMQVLDEIKKISSLDIRFKYLPERRFDVAVNILDSSKLTEHTGWRPETSFEEGLSKSWDFICRYSKENL